MELVGVELFKRALLGSTAHLVKCALLGSTGVVGSGFGVLGSGVLGSGCLRNLVLGSGCQLAGFD